MIVCPVCENPQQTGDTCDVCGKLLVPVRQANAAPVTAIPELEVTRHTGPQNVVSQAIEGLEVTSLDAKGPIAPERVDGLEFTAVVSRNIQVPVDRVPELELTREVDTGPKTVAPTGAVSCRYCGNVQAEGLLCARCGMRLPRARVAQAATVGGVANPKAEAVWTRCSKCGSPAKAGGPCGDCGVFVEFPDGA